MRRKATGMRESEARWRPRLTRRRRGSTVAAIAEELRRRVYYRQNGAERLTPRQRRRVVHKANAGRG